MAVLKAAARKALPGSQFAGPHRSFPIPDASHARAALSMAHYAPNPSAIRAAVHRRYPSIGQRARGGPVVPGRGYVVGERGPEVMVPRTAGTVVPNQNLGPQRAPRFAEAAQWNTPPPGRAFGGAVGVGRPYLVGERGPEMLRSPRPPIVAGPLAGGALGASIPRPGTVPLIGGGGLRQGPLQARGGLPVNPVQARNALMRGLR